MSSPSLFRSRTDRQDGAAFVDLSQTSYRQNGQSSAQMSVEDLRRKLATQPVIEQAKGVLMVLYGIDSAAAFAVLRRWSQKRNVKVHTLAGELLAIASRSHPTRFDALRVVLKSDGALDEQRD